MNYDEFMRRTLELTTIPNERRQALASIGQAYLAKVRAIDRNTKALAPGATKTEDWNECFAPF